MHRPPLSKVLVVALLGVSSCTTKQVNNQSNNVSAIPDKQVTQGTTGRVVQITDGSYSAEVLQSSTPVLIFFWAPWSAPDRMMAPSVEAIANEYAGRVKVGKVDVDENAELARKFRIEGIPTLVLIESGSEQERVVGAISKEAIRRILEKQRGSRPGG